MTTPSPISDQAAGELPGWRKPPENEHPYAKKMREAHEKKYGNLAGIVYAFNIYRNVIERFRRPYNGEMSDCVTNADLDAAEQEMLSNVREEIRWISVAPTTGSAPCVCGIPSDASSVHRQDGPCYRKDVSASPAANVLTDVEINEWIDGIYEEAQKVSRLTFRQYVRDALKANHHAASVNA